MKFKKIIAVALSGVFCINLALTSTVQAAHQNINITTQTAQTKISSISGEEITAEEKQVVKEIQAKTDKSSKTNQTKAAKVLNKVKKIILSKPSRIVFKSILSVISLIIGVGIARFFEDAFVVDGTGAFFSVYIALEAATNAIDLYLIEKIA